MQIDFSEIQGYKDDGLRDYQQENKTRIYELWKSCQSVMLQMPTGTGKTRLFVSILKDLHNYSVNHKSAVKALILAHRTELLDQISDELGFKYGVAHGIIHAGDREKKKYPVQVASVQTLIRRLDDWKYKNFDFIVVDEAHHVLAESYMQIVKAFPDAKLLGVTATPYRMSGRGFVPEFNELVVSSSVREFIKNGWLSNYEYYSIPINALLQQQINGIKKFDIEGDYRSSEMMRVCDNDRIRAQVVETYLKLAKGKKGIVYTINQEHNKHLCKKFEDAGVRAVAIDSKTKADVREKAIEDFKEGKYDIICNVNIFTEGFDCPDIEFIQLARPTKSLGLFLQQVGRGLRISKGKEKVLFLDNVGLYNKFGFPSTNRDWKQYFLGNGGEENQICACLKNDVTAHREVDYSEGNEEVHLIEFSDEIYDTFVSEEEKRIEKKKPETKSIVAGEGDCLFVKMVDKSLFYQGMTIPVEFHKRVEDAYGREVQRGEQLPITLYLNNESYKAILTNLAFNLEKYPTHKRILQIRWTENMPIVKALRNIFPDSFKYIVEQRKSQEKKKAVKLPNDLQDKVALYSTSENGCFRIEPVFAERYEFFETSNHDNTDIITPNFVTENKPVQIPKQDNGEPKHKKGIKRLIKVTYPDGRVVMKDNTEDTLIDVIENSNPELIYNLDIPVDDVNLVSRTLAYDKHSQKRISGGYYVVVKSSIADKIYQIKTISEELNLGLIVEEVEKQQGKFELFGSNSNRKIERAEDREGYKYIAKRILEGATNSEILRELNVLDKETPLLYRKWNGHKYLQSDISLIRKKVLPESISPKISACEWRKNSKAFKLAEQRINEGVSLYSIVEELKELNSLYPGEYCSSAGNVVTEGVLNSWKKHMKINASHDITKKKYTVHEGLNIVALQKYVEIFQSLHSAKISNRLAPHKAILLLTIMNLIRKKIIVQPAFKLMKEEITEEFGKIWDKRVIDDKGWGKSVWTPFWHMKSEKFWHLTPKVGMEEKLREAKMLPYTPSFGQLNEMVEGARIDEDLFELLRNKGTRMVLRDILIATYDLK